jgi:hypothetical protein
VPPERVFFTDRDLGRHKLPNLLRQGGLQVEVHHDHFEPDAADVDWLPKVAARGWIVLSNDQQIMRRPLEREAVRASGSKNSWTLTRRRSSPRSIVRAPWSSWSRVALAGSNWKASW